MLFQTALTRSEQVELLGGVDTGVFYLPASHRHRNRLRHITSASPPVLRDS